MMYLISPDERKMLNNAGDRMPLGILYLSAALNQAHIQNECYDMNHESWTGLLKKIEQNKPDAVGLSCLSPTAKQMRKFAIEVKKKVRTNVIIGGYHATHRPTDFIDVADSVVKGYGESGIFWALEELNGKICEPGFDINLYPIPDRSKLPKERYNYTLEGLKATTMITSRGCPHNCVFCSNFDKQQKRRNLDNICEELDIIKSMGYEAVYLVDDSFTLNKEHAFNVGMELYKRDLKYRVELRATQLDRELAEYLGQTGCLVAGIGIESGNDDILKNCNKATNTERIRYAVKNLARNGVKVKGFFIIGLPGETEQTAQDTLHFANELKGLGLSYADFYPMCPYPGSPIGDTPDKYGIEVLCNDYKKYLNGGKTLVIPAQTKDLSADRIKEYIKRARQLWQG